MQKIVDFIKQYYPLAQCQSISHNLLFVQYQPHRDFEQSNYLIVNTPTLKGILYLDDYFLKEDFIEEENGVVQWLTKGYKSVDDLFDNIQYILEMNTQNVANDLEQDGVK